MIHPPGVRNVSPGADLAGPVRQPWSRVLLADAAVDGFAQEVRVTRMASRFLDEMQQNRFAPAQCGISDGLAEASGDGSP